MKKEEIEKLVIEECVKRNIPCCGLEYKKFYSRNNGYYNFKQLKIVLRRKSKEVVLHELCHHIDYCLNGQTKHNKRFYAYCKELGGKPSRFLNGKRRKI